MKMTFSARQNDDYSYRGLGWNASHVEGQPLIIVGHNMKESYYTRRDAIRAARRAAVEKGLIKDARVKFGCLGQSGVQVGQGRTGKD